jgi:hypothetical protein
MALERPSRLGAGSPDQARLLAPAERRRGRGPGLAVAWEAVRPELGTHRDQCREVGDRLDRAHLGHADEAVRVEVVAQQQGRVGVGGLEQPRPAVVEEVALVDRLQPERVALLAERREDRLELTLAGRAKRLLPEPALATSFPRNRFPEVDCYSQPASSFVQ